MSFLKVKKIKNHYYLYECENVYKRDGRTYKKVRAKRGEGVSHLKRNKWTKRKFEKYLGRIKTKEFVTSSDFTFDDYLLQEKQITLRKLFDEFDYDDIVKYYHDYIYYILGLNSSIFRDYYAVNEGFFGPWSIQKMLNFRFNGNATNRQNLIRYSITYLKSGFPRHDKILFANLYKKMMGLPPIYKEEEEQFRKEELIASETDVKQMTFKDWVNKNSY